MDHCNVTVQITLKAEWAASLVGHASKDEMTNSLRASLLGDLDEVVSLPNVRIVSVYVGTY